MHTHTWTDLYMAASDRCRLAIAMEQKQRYKRCECGAVGIETTGGIRRLDPTASAYHIDDAKKYV